MSESVQTEQPQQEDTLSQKRNVLRVVTEKQLITPGQSQQLIIKSDMDGTILGVVLGPKHPYQGGELRGAGGREHGR